MTTPAQLTLSAPQLARLARLEREATLAVERLGRMLRSGRMERATVEGVKIQLERAMQ